MIQVNNLTMQFGGQLLFKDAELKFTGGNCYGIIGANGAGKSTFLRILCGELEPTKGEIVIDKGTRMSVLRQDHFAFDAYTVLDTVIMGNKRLYEIMQEKDALYAKEDFSDEDGEKAAALEGEFAELNSQMSELDGNQKVKVLLAQALFGNPDIILLDEPTNHLDVYAIRWLEDFLADYFGTVLVVSHDRHFLNNVCTHIVDFDYGKVKMYVGNYEFWYDSSQLMQRLIKQQNRKAEEKIKELQEFISRFAANKSKSRQATSRRKLLDKLSMEEIPASTRKYPYIGFTPDRELGKDILTLENVCASDENGEPLLKNVSFALNRTDKVAIIGKSEQAITALFRILAEEIEPESGTVKWGISTSRS